jgi:RNA polymerase sigma-70 factor (ECF subfamily)
MTTEKRVQSARNGDSEAYRQLVEEAKTKLYAIALAYLHSEDDALEAIQEAVCRAYIQLGKLKEPRFFHTWLVRILIRCCIDEQKRRRRVLPLFAIPETLAADLALDEKLHLRMEIDRLPPKLRHVVILKYYRDMTLPEIAGLLEKPEGTVKTWLNKALKKLRAGLRREGESGYVQSG